jgi:hypothetical protein
VAGAIVQIENEQISARQEQMQRKKKLRGKHVEMLPNLGLLEAASGHERDWRRNWKKTPNTNEIRGEIEGARRRRCPRAAARRVRAPQRPDGVWRRATSGTSRRTATVVDGRSRAALPPDRGAGGAGPHARWPAELRPRRSAAARVLPRELFFFAWRTDWLRKGSAGERKKKKKRRVRS